MNYWRRRLAELEARSARLSRRLEEIGETVPPGMFASEHLEDLTTAWFDLPEDQRRGRLRRNLFVD